MILDESKLINIIQSISNIKIILRNNAIAQLLLNINNNILITYKFYYIRSTVNETIYFIPQKNIHK